MSIIHFLILMRLFTFYSCQFFFLSQSFSFFRFSFHKNKNTKTPFSNISNDKSFGLLFCYLRSPACSFSRLSFTLHPFLIHPVGFVLSIFQRGLYRCLLPHAGISNGPPVEVPRWFPTASVRVPGYHWLGKTYIDLLYSGFQCSMNQLGLHSHWVLFPGSHGVWGAGTRTLASEWLFPPSRGSVTQGLSSGPGGSEPAVPWPCLSLGAPTGAWIEWRPATAGELAVRPDSPGFIRSTLWHKSLGYWHDHLLKSVLNPWFIFLSLFFS